VSVAYFDQSILFLYLTLAMTATLRVAWAGVPSYTAAPQEEGTPPMTGPAPWRRRGHGPRPSRCRNLGSRCIRGNRQYRRNNHRRFNEPRHAECSIQGDTSWAYREWGETSGIEHGYG